MLLKEETCLVNQQGFSTAAASWTSSLQAVDDLLTPEILPGGKELAPSCIPEYGQGGTVQKYFEG